MLRFCCNRTILASTSGIAHAPTIRIVRRDEDNNSIARTEIAKPIHEARVTVAPSAKTSPITASNVTVSYRLECTDSAGSVSTYSSNDSAVFDAYTCGSGTVKEARYIQVALTDKYSPMFPVHFASFTAGDGTYHLSATAGMRTK